MQFKSKHISLFVAIAFLIVSSANTLHYAFYKHLQTLKNEDAQAMFSAAFNHDCDVFILQLEYFQYSDFEAFCDATDLILNYSNSIPYLTYTEFNFGRDPPKVLITRTINTT